MKKPIIGITGDIDNNRFSIKMSYSSAIEKAGAVPFLLQPCSSKHTIKSIAAEIDALLISGGGDIDPVCYDEKPKTNLLKVVSDKRFIFEMALLDEVIYLNKPVLGICYGMQFLNVFFGGSLYQDLKKQKPDTLDHKLSHKVRIYNKSKLYYILGIGDAEVNSVHHQGVKRLGKRLSVSAVSGDGLIEAIELKEYPYLIGVQWHPERLSDKYSRRLLRSFVKAA
ncbi:MAG: gamma-glutamyl-gamma-aminobutyrate hydrolase family protein [Nitrospirae bacterium]|nr:gamma-glutamyl-gamma-aminobutyrate hydrolase family protein [Nitrospirota bacterium]